MSLNFYPVPLNVVVNKTETCSIIRLLLFINETFNSNLSTMKDLATGAIYCQILNRMYPKSIPISKVKLFTCSVYDFQANYKLLEAGFNKLKVTKYIPSEDLIKGRGHLEFCNWMVKFYLTNTEVREYNPKIARNGSEIRPRATGNHMSQNSIPSVIPTPTVNQVSPPEKSVKEDFLEKSLEETLKKLEEANKTIKEKDRQIGVLEKNLLKNQGRTLMEIMLHVSESKRSS